MDNERNEQLREEFTVLCKPLNEWLQKNFHPHAKIVIDFDHAELVEGFIGVPFELKD